MSTHIGNFCVFLPMCVLACRTPFFMHRQSADGLPGKVGDTLIATVTGAAAASYEWAVSLDGEEWSVIDSETDETFDVTADLVGMYVKVTVTAEDEETASDATVLPVEEADGQIEITSAEAIAANKIAVTLAEAVDATDTVATLTKGSNTFAVTAEWAETNDSVTLTTAAKMTEGTYTVTLTSTEDETNTDSAEFTVEGQKVAEIVILNDVALTSKDKKTAYAYYDVLDQYGESMRASTSIQWSGSAKPKVNKADGQLELTKNDGTAWVYNDKIYLTGVYTKTGVAMSKELTVGTEQSLDTIEMKGFVKKGSSDILKKLPADFKDGEYYMIFNALDQNGNNIAAEDVTKEDVTFVSDNVLVVKELSQFAATPLTIKGDAYNAVFVTPGIKVADGGEVTVTAIANKTGNKTEMNFVVGEDPVVMSFNLSAPATTVADGDSVEIPFEALDEDGNPIKNFLTLAKQETFNTLSFNASEGSLKLAEQDNGTAKLTWTDDAKFADDDAWSLSQTTDGIDRPVSLTVVVVGGVADNEMISVSDKRRPDAIAEVKLDSVYVEGAAPTATLTDSFKFFDQYGEVIGSDWGADNGFFEAGYDGKTLKGTDFAEYQFGVRVQNAGAGKITYTGGAFATTTSNDKLIIKDGWTAAFATATDIKSAATGEGFKFEIAKVKPSSSAGISASDPEDWESVSPSKFVPLTVVDISQVKNLVIGDLNTFYVGAVKEGDGEAHAGTTVTGDQIINSTIKDDLKDSAVSVVTNGDKAGIYADDSDYQQAVKVTGTYNGSEVTIPNSYYTISANKMQDTDGDDKFNAIIPYAVVAGKANGGLQAADLYDKTTAKGTAKLADDEVTATVYKLYSDETASETFFWKWDGVKHDFAESDIPAGTRPAMISTLLSEANATLTNATNITDAKNIAKEAAQLAAINDVLTGEGYDEVATTAAIIGADRTVAKADTTSKANAATKLTEAKATLVTKQNAEADAKAELSTANAAKADTLGAGITATTGDGVIEAYDYSGLDDDLRDAAIDYLKAVRDKAVAADALATANIADAGDKADADALASDTELKSMSDAQIDSAVDASAIVAGKQDAAKAYLKAKRNDLLAADAVTTERAELNALKTGASATADTLGVAIDETTTNDQIVAYDYAGAGLAPEEVDAQNYLKAKRDTKAAAAGVTKYENAYKAWVEDEAETAGLAAWTSADDAAVEAAFAAHVDENNANATTGIHKAAVYDTAKAAITLSDQAPYAATITGVPATCTLTPYDTDAVIVVGADILEDVELVDQYGVKFAGDILLTVSDITETPDGYAANNFAVTGNGEALVGIEGAERMDTFTLTLSYGTIKETTTVTVGADECACIVDSDNVYNRVLKKTLDKQRIAGLG